MAIWPSRVIPTAFTSAVIEMYLLAGGVVNGAPRKRPRTAVGRSRASRTEMICAAESELLNQNDDQRVQCQRFDQRHADDEGDTDRAAGSRIACRAFAGRRSRESLTDTATCRRD